MQPEGELIQVPLAAGVCLHLHRISSYKTVRVDICLSERIRKKRHSRLALISRLLERGTRKLPDLQSLNRFIDELFGAHYYAEINRLGGFQLIHLCLEVIDDQLLEDRDGRVLAKGLEFLRGVLLEPAGDEFGFQREYLDQEKRFLARQIADSYNDKLGYAQQRCVEEMCRGEPIALSPLGDSADFAEIEADKLLCFHRRLLAENRIDLFVSGNFNPQTIVAMVEDFFTWERDGYRSDEGVEPKTLSRLARDVYEIQDIHQAKMVLGYRSGVFYGSEDYPALLLLNVIIGGDGQSRLFKHLREEQGLCYYAASHIEALCGLLFIVVGIEAESHLQVRNFIDEQIKSLRQGCIERDEIESARRLLRVRLLGLREDREAFFLYQLREGFVGGSAAPSELWKGIEKVQVEDLVRVARGLVADTSYFLHGVGR